MKSILIWHLISANYNLPCPGSWLPGGLLPGGLGPGHLQLGHVLVLVDTLLHQAPSDYNHGNNKNDSHF